MTSHRRDEDCGAPSGRFSGFLRSLLSGIPWSELAECEESRSFKAPVGRILRVRNSNGRIEVIGEDREDVLVDVAKRARAESSQEAERLLGAIRLVEQDSADALELEVEVPRRWNRHGHVNLVVHVPRAQRVQVESVNGKVAVSGLRAPVGARSSNGSVTVDHVEGDVEIYTANAKVACSCTCGKLVARSSNGKIEVVEHRGSLDASTSNGLIRASLEAFGPDGVLLATSNGRIVLDIPADADADVDIRVDNGIVRNELELSGASRSSDGRLRGKLGRGGVPIKLRTSNGSVSLR